MGAGNPSALLQTILSVQGVVDEIIFGDMLLFPEDREKISKYVSFFNIKVLEMPFDFIFQHGFGVTLNTLARRAAFDWVLYLNVGEVIAEGKDKILVTVAMHQDCNTFFFDHATDPHRWHRLYRKSELQWNGLIHEEVGPHDLYRPYHKPLFRMADLPKDSDSLFKARVLDDAKEIIYFHQYMRLMEVPARLGYAHENWLTYSRNNYDSMRDRLLKKGARYDAYCQRDYARFMNQVYSSPDFANERYESGIGCEFQTDKKYLL